MWERAVRKSHTGGATTSKATAEANVTSGVSARSEAGTGRRRRKDENVPRRQEEIGRERLTIDGCVCYSQPGRISSPSWDTCSCKLELHASDTSVALTMRSCCSEG